MAQFKADDLAREMKRWAWPDARHFVRPDWRRFVKPGSDAAAAFEIYERKYRPDQARVPPGNRDGGQWTDEGGGDGSISGTGGDVAPSSGANDPRVLSDAIPDNYYKPGAQVAARISPAREAECEEQYRKDTFICNTIGTASCWEQAMFRRAQCLRGQYVPPFHF
jgi:hypothetical protein